MSYTQNYQTALDLAASMKDFSTLVLLEGLLPEQRPGEVERFFLSAADAFADEAACAYFNLLVNSVGDCELALFIIKLHGKTVLHYSPENDKEFHLAEAQAVKTRALKAMEMYGRLPVSRKNTRDDYPPVATLLGAKKVVLTEVCQGWLKAVNEEDADACLLFLVEAVKSVKFTEEMEEQRKIFYAVTERGFSPERLARHFAMLMSKDSEMRGFSSNLENFASILVKAWARNCPLGKSSRTLRACQSLLERKEEHNFKTAPAFDLSRRVNTEIADFDLAVQELFGSFGLWSRTDDVPGKKSVYYPDAKRAEISIVVPVSMGNYRFDDELLKKDGNKWYEMARDRAKEWRKKYMQYSLYLKLSVHGEFSPSPRFERSEEITLMP